MSDTESDSSSSDPRDLSDAEESDQDGNADIVSRAPVMPPKDGDEEGGSGEDAGQRRHPSASASKDADSQDTDSEGGKQSEAEAPPKYGLLWEFEATATIHEPFDIVVVHSIRETSWTDANWRQGWGFKAATSWIYDELGFRGGRFLHFHYDFKNIHNDRPDVLYKGGIEREAQKLIDGLLELRRQVNAPETDNGFAVGSKSRGIVFVAHDIGGIIVKKALTFAALNPFKYGDIPFHTTNLVFLGCPHRCHRVDLEDQVTRMLLLTEDSFQDWALESIKVLTRTILRVNEEFLDTKILLHASVYNIANRGRTDTYTVPAPWRVVPCYYNLPFEFVQETQIPHMALADGDSSVENIRDKFTNNIRRMLGRFPFHIDPQDHAAQIQKTFFSMSPPALPPSCYEYPWQPYDYEPWAVETDQYKSWAKDHTQSVLHYRGPSPMRLASEKLWEWILYDIGDIAEPRNRATAFFAFNREDARFRTVEQLAGFMIANIVARNQQVEEIRPIYDMLLAQRAWTAQDLLQAFFSCHGTPTLRPMAFMIACLEECDDSIYQLLDLIAKLSSLSERPFRFILTSTSGVEDRLNRELVKWPTIDIATFQRGGWEWSLSFDSRYGLDMRLLLEKKPVYAHFATELRDLLGRFGPDDRLGDLILRWLIHGKQNNSRAGVKRTLAAIPSLTYDSFLEMVVASFGVREKRARDVLKWVTFAYEPLTTFELGIGVELSQGTDEDDLEDVYFDEVQEDVKQFTMVFAYRDHDVRFWHVWKQYRTPPTPEEAAAGHGELARMCLRYLGFPSVIKRIRQMCDCYVSLDLDQPPPMRPRDDLVSYAVLYWPKHYALAGQSKPKDEAVGFFQDKAVRNAWWSARYVLSNHMVRLNRGYISPLPTAAMTGLEDVVAVLLETERSDPHFAANAGMALVEAVRDGHGSTAKLIIHASRPGQDDLRDAISAAAASGDESTLNRLIRLALEEDGFAWPAGLFSRVAWLGHVGSARLLLDAGIKMSRVGATYTSSPLHAAVQARQKDMVRLLLAAKCDPEVEDQFGYTPLARAACQGCPEIVHMLIAAGADTETATNGGIKPIQLAVLHAKHKAVRALLEGGADADAGAEDDPAPESDSASVAEAALLEDKVSAKALPLAAINGYTECVRALLDHGANVKATLDRRTALWHAAYGGHFEISRLLLEKGADPNEHPDSHDPVLTAVIGSGLSGGELIALVELLIQHGARVDQQDKAGGWQGNPNPLSRAAGRGNLQLVQLLLDKGAPPNIGAGVTDTPLYVAAFEGDEEIVNLLLDKGADVNTPCTWDWTPLHAAYDKVKIVKILLDRGADINKVSQTGTVTYLAAKHNQEDVLRELLEHSTKPELDLQLAYQPERNLSEDEDGMTPLCIACKKGYVNIMNLLLSNKANANHRTKDGSFPLEFCLDTEGESPLAVMEALLEFRPILTLADDHGNTVLHNVSNTTDVGVVKMLYTAGANINVINKVGKSPLILAVEADNATVARFLIEKGADTNVYSAETGTILNTMARRRGPWEVFEAAVKAGADVSLAHQKGYKETLLHSAMGGFWDEDTEKIVRYLLDEAKVDPNERCNDEVFGYPIIKCARLQYTDALRLLLDHGADPNVEDAQGRRAIHMAAFRYWDFMDLLIEKRADPIPRTKSGMSPLHFAAASTSYFEEIFENLRRVIEGGPEGDDESPPAGRDAADGSQISQEKRGGQQDDTAKPKLDVNDPDRDGWTPLMWMSKGNFSGSDTIRNLVQQGADLWVTAPVLDISGNDREWSPLKAARYYGSDERVYEALTPEEKRRVLPDGRTEEWDDARHETPMAVYIAGISCDHCLMNTVGLTWRCRQCTFVLCYKCARSRSVLHPGHDLEANGPEYDVPLETPESSASAPEDPPTPFVDNTILDLSSDDDDDDEDNNDEDGGGSDDADTDSTD